MDKKFIVFCDVGAVNCGNLYPWNESVKMAKDMIEITGKKYYILDTKTLKVYKCTTEFREVE